MSDSERWCTNHMGVMAFHRTIMAAINLTLTAFVTLKVFGVI